MRKPDSLVCIVFVPTNNGIVDRLVKPSIHNTVFPHETSLPHFDEVAYETNTKQEERLRLRTYASILDGLPWSEIVYCNSVDDLEFHVHDTVEHLSFADTFTSFGEAPNLERVEGEPSFRRECVVRSEGETMDKNAPRFYSTVSWYGKTLHSCSPPVHRMTYEWLLKNENAIAFMLTADSRLFVCTIIGYAVFRVNGLPYAQAICLPLPCSSTSSFTKTPHKVLLHKDGVDIDTDTQ